MRRSPPWWKLADDRILEYLRDHEAAGPTEIANSDSIHFSQPWVSRRLTLLKESGFVRVIAQGTYVITERGEGYLAEEFDASHVEEPQGNSGKATA